MSQPVYLTGISVSCLYVVEFVSEFSVVEFNLVEFLWPVFSVGDFVTCFLTFTEKLWAISCHFFSPIPGPFGLTESIYKYENLGYSYHTTG